MSKQLHKALALVVCCAAVLVASAAATVADPSAVNTAAAMPMHPDLLDFIQLPAAGVDEPTAGRKLLQAGGGLFQEGEGPFTFDGFDFGYGGIRPGGGFFDGFGVNIYRLLFGSFLNQGLNENLAEVITNNPLQPFDFIPPTIGNRLNRNVVSLFGFDAVDKFVGQYLTRASAKVGKLIEAGCAGPTYSVTVKAGECKLADDGSVECGQPTVELASTPYTCNLPYREAAKLEGQSYKYKVAFGREREGIIGLPAGEYNFGAAINATVPNLGFSLATAQLADDFGVQQWYQFAGNVILNNILRIQAALLSGAVDSRILTQAAREAAAAGPRSAPIADGVSAVADAGNLLLDRIAQTMGISTEDLTDGLKAVNALPAQLAAQQQPQQQQQQRQAEQPKKQQPAAAGKGVVPNVAGPEEEKGGKVVTTRSDEKEGDQSLLEPVVKKAEGPQP